MIYSVFMFILRLMAKGIIMKIKATKWDRRSYSLYMFAVPMWIIILILIKVWKVEDADIIVWGSVSVMFITAPLMISLCTYFLRNIELSEQGCTFQILNHRKTYVWNEMTVLFCKNDTGIGEWEWKHPGILLSGIPVQKPSKILAQTYCSLRHPFASVFIRFDTNYTSQYVEGGFAVPREDLIQILNQYHVEISEFNPNDAELKEENNGTITLLPCKHEMANMTMAQIVIAIFLIAACAELDWNKYGIISTSCIGILMFALMTRSRSYYNRTIILDSNGCTFESPRCKHFWQWDELTVYYCRNDMGNPSDTAVTSGIIITETPFKIPITRSGEDYCELRYPQTSVFICFFPDKKMVELELLPRGRGYLIEKEKLLSFLEQNHVEVIRDPNFQKPLHPLSPRWYL